MPVSISPRTFVSSSSTTTDNILGGGVSGVGGGKGGVSNAALIYTKCALESIVTSLNERAKKSSNNDGSARTHTIRDLSTCLGAWDLTVSGSSNSNPNKRAKTDEGGGNNDNENNMNDGNADTAFQFYYERSCPILLDAKGDSKGRRTSYCVEDFGGGMDDTNNELNEQLPAVAGAVVLTYGADSTFTGGIGEEGVLTKAIVEFFHDEAVVTEDCDNTNRNMSEEDVMVEAEEQLYARVDPAEGQSLLIKAALSALSPPTDTKSSPKNSTDSSADDGVYIPTIWSGNTNRIYQYCLLGNFGDDGKERASKRLCVAIQKKTRGNCPGDNGPAKGVCRITLTLSPASVLAKKKLMAKAAQDIENAELDSDNSTQTCSEVHRTIRQNLRILRPPTFKTISDLNNDGSIKPGKRRRNALRRSSITQQLLNPESIVVGVRCQHELLVDAEEVGKIYVNGSLAVDCSKPLVRADTMPSHTLFGVDFTLPASSSGSTSSSSSALLTKSVIEKEYGALLVDALIFAGQSDADVAGKLLGRLITGNTERPESDDVSTNGAGSRYHDSLPRMESCYAIKFDNISQPCLESIVLSSSVDDPVGIGAKAIGTKFRMQYGKEAFPCDVGTSEEYRLHRLLGAQKIAKVVPRRARDVLRRGGYLGISSMASLLWTKGQGGISWDGDHSDAMRAAEAMEGAIKLLRKAGVQDVKPNKIHFVARKKLEPVMDDDVSISSCSVTSISKLKCWYDPSSGSYYISDAILFIEEGIVEQANVGGDVSSEAGSSSAAKEEPRREADMQQESKSGEADAGGAKLPTIMPSIPEEPKEDPNKQGDALADSDTGVTKEGSSNDDTKSAPPPQDQAAKEDEETNRRPKAASAEDAAYLLAFYIAREHPDARMLERFATCHRAK